MTSVHHIIDVNHGCWMASRKRHANGSCEEIGQVFPGDKEAFHGFISNSRYTIADLDICMAAGSTQGLIDCMLGEIAQLVFLETEDDSIASSRRLGRYLT